MSNTPNFTIIEKAATIGTEEEVGEFLATLDHAGLLVRENVIQLFSSVGWAPHAISDIFDAWTEENI